MTDEIFLAIGCVLVFVVVVLVVMIR